MDVEAILDEAGQRPQAAVELEQERRARASKRGVPGGGDAGVWVGAEDDAFEPGGWNRLPVEALDHPRE